MKAGRSFLWGALSFLLLWWGISLLADNRSLPDPYQTFQRFWQLRAELGLHAGASVIRVLISLFFALLIGIPLGIFLGRTKIAAIVDPLLYFLYPIPKVAFHDFFWFRECFKGDPDFFGDRDSSCGFDSRWGKRNPSNLLSSDAKLHAKPAASDPFLDFASNHAGIVCQHAGKYWYLACLLVLCGKL